MHYWLSSDNKVFTKHVEEVVEKVKEDFFASLFLHSKNIPDVSEEYIGALRHIALAVFGEKAFAAAFSSTDTIYPKEADAIKKRLKIHFKVGFVLDTRDEF